MVNGNINYIGLVNNKLTRNKGTQEYMSIAIFEYSVGLYKIPLFLYGQICAVTTPMYIQKHITIHIRITK